MKRKMSTLLAALMVLALCLSGCGSKEVSGQGGSMTCAGVNGVRVGRCGVNTRVVPPDSGPFGDGSPVFFV